MTAHNYSLHRPPAMLSPHETVVCGRSSTSSDSGCHDLRVRSASDESRLSSCAVSDSQEMVSVETFIDYVNKGDVERIKLAVRETSFDINTEDEDGRTALHHAIINGVVENCLDIARHLLDFGIDPNIKDNTAQRESAIHVALRLGHLAAVKMILETVAFDLVRCDAFQSSKMLPETCIIDDINRDDQADTDTTLTKRTSFGDQYMLFVRQNTSEYIENNFPPGRESIRDMIILQDECISPLHELVHRIDYAQLRSLYIVHCKVELEDGECFTNLSLTTLVLSQTHLHRLPATLFEMDSLEVLRVDRNKLEEIPDEIGNLRNLRCFSCDTQRPRLRSLPLSLSSLDRLQTLSFCNNRLDSIAWVVGLSNLRTLRCSCNRITRLPNQLAHLAELTVLDVSHNRLDVIQPCLVDLVQRLYRFDYYNLTLRPRHVRHDKRQLLAHLRLENFFAAQPPSAPATAGRDITVGVVGESHSGKSTLVEALRADKGLCKQDTAARESAFEIHQFEMRSSAAGGSGESRYISTIVLANDLLDNYSGAVQVDLFLLTVDLTALELQNGSQHLFARHMSRLQLWLQALYELAPDTPVLLVGTHAELVHAAAAADLWHVVGELLEQARPHHARRYADCRLGHCLLCSPRSMHVRHVVAKSRAGSAGFVDLSYPHGVPLLNGHASIGPEPPPPAGGTALGRVRCPHVVGYYETDSRKNLPKDAKKSNVSIEQLKGAIIRLTVTGEEGISPNWISFIRHVATIKERAPDLPCVPYDQIVSISRSFDIAPAQVPFMLQYFHQRGKLVYFEGDALMAKLVVINPTWFVVELSRLMDALDSSQCGVTQLLACMQYKEVERQLQKAGVSLAQWLLAALQRLELCVPCAGSLHGGEQRFLLPHLLEAGPPSPDVWADMPEWDEKQITCDFAIRTLKPRFFTDLVLRLNDAGRRALQIVADPAPVFLSHHLVFYTSTDVGGCDDCYALRHRLRRRRRRPRAGSPVPPADEPTSQDDVLHKVHVQLHPRMDSIRIAVRGVTPCCTMKAVIHFIELYLDDVPEDESDCSSDRTSISSHALSSGSGSTSVCASALNTNGSTCASVSACSGGCSSDRGSMTSNSHTTTVTSTTTTTTTTSDNDDDERQLFLLCPKCVLMRHANPERICYHTMSPRRKAICSRWHNLGSWSRVVTGDYRIYDHVSSNCLNLPDYEHPRLVLVLPPSSQVSTREWYMGSRLKFLEGFEVHFLCEYTGYWHFTDGCAFRLNQSADFVKRVGSQLPSILTMALAMVQVINGVPEHSINGRLLSPVIAEMVKMYDYLRNADTHMDDPYKWLAKNKDRVVSMLSKVLATCSDGFPDLYFKIGNVIDADSIFHSASHANRYDLARFLRVQPSPARFAQLRPLYVGKEIRWLCEAHYDELRHMPSS